MTAFGVALSSEELGPRELVAAAQAAERAGFERVWVSAPPRRGTVAQPEVDVVAVGVGAAVEDDGGVPVVVGVPVGGGVPVWVAVGGGVVDGGRVGVRVGVGVGVGVVLGAGCAGARTGVVGTGAGRTRK